VSAVSAAPFAKRLLWICIRVGGTEEETAQRDVDLLVVEGQLDEVLSRLSTVEKSIAPCQPDRIFRRGTPVETLRAEIIFDRRTQRTKRFILVETRMSLEKWWSTVG